MDTLQLIKINDNQLLGTLTINGFPDKTLQLDLKIESLKDCSRKITHDILGRYLEFGPNKTELENLKKEAYNLFNLLNFFELEQYFNKLRKKTGSNYLHLILDKDTNLIPFEILHDGKDFLSNYIILSRTLTDSHKNFNHNLKIKSNEEFALLGNPSESDDINEYVINELNSISQLVDSAFNLRGPFKHRNIDKIELIRLLGTTSLLHFSGHYKNDGWKLFNDSFRASDIKKCSRTPKFLFFNSCGDYANSFIELINSFLTKGTQSIISGSGKLPSKRASEFSNIFYKFFILNKHTIGKSLFLAKQEMMKKYGLQDFFWCFYQLYGSSLMKIDKKRTITIKKHNSFKFKYILSFLMVVFISYYGSTYFLNGKFFNKKIKINVKSNINSKSDIYSIEVDSIFKWSNSKCYPIFLKCDSISMNSPFFSLVNSKQIKHNQIIIDYDDSLFTRYSYHYENGLLNLFFSNKDIYQDVHFLFDDSIRYSVYMQSGLLENSFILYIVDQLNNKRYKIDSNKFYSMIQKEVKLVKGKNLKLEIHKDYLEQYIDDGIVEWTRNSKLELINRDFNFENELIVYINKALIN